MTKTAKHTSWKQPTSTTYLNVTGAEIEVTFLELYLVPDKYHEEMIKLSINKPHSFTLFPYYKEEKRIKSPFFSLISLFSAAQKDKLHPEFTLETWNNRKKDYTWRNYHKENTSFLYPFFVSFSHTFFRSSVWIQLQLFPLVGLIRGKKIIKKRRSKTQMNKHILSLKMVGYQFFFFSLVSSIRQRPPNNQLKEEEIFKISEMRETNIYVQIKASTHEKLSLIP